MAWEELPSDFVKDAIVGALALFGLFVIALRKLLTEDNMESANMPSVRKSDDIVIRVSLKEIVDEMRSEQEEQRDMMADQTARLRRIEEKQDSQRDESVRWAETVEDRLSSQHERILKLEAKIKD
jgi:TRAP-type mannitol/chloroaromatic compound transport system substrate-binding protein